MGNRGRIAALVVALAAVMLTLAPHAGAIARHAAFALGIASPQRQLQLGDRMVALDVTGLDGSGVRLQTDGRPRIINVFATWCIPCRSEMPALAHVAQALRGSGVDVVGIDQFESAGTVERFAQAYDLRYPLYIDGDGVSHAVLGARFIPTTIAVDAHGVIRFEHAGPLTREDFFMLARAVAMPG